MALSLKAMEYFVTALRHGNIANAAAELNIAASAISTSIDQVEATFDLKLVTRQRSRGIQANASGLEVARKLEGLLEDYRGILSEGADLKQALSGRLRIGYYAPVAPAFLPDILASFVPDISKIELHLDQCDNNAAQEGLLSGQYDVILFVSDDAKPIIDFDVLVKAPPYCLLPKGHPLAAQNTVTMEQIAQHPLIALNRPVASAYYQSLFDVKNVSLSVAAYANSVEMVRSLVSAGQGIAILNMRPSTSISYCGAELVECPISDELPPLTLSLGYDKTRPRRLVQHFVAACLSHFQDVDAERCVLYKQ